MTWLAKVRQNGSSTATSTSKSITEADGSKSTTAARFKIYDIVFSSPK